MEFGIFHEFPSLPGRSHAEAFAQSFELVDGAERWGLDAMWLGELHFDPARSVLSAPLCIASAIAARTQRMKIGLAVQVLPLCHPLRLAEEAATVDQISNGRLIFGVGRSGVARTYEAYGVPYGESRERFAEVLDIVQKAWTQETVSYQGKYHRFEDVTVVPQAVPAADPADPCRRHQCRYVCIHRPAGPADLRRRPLRDRRRNRAEHPRLSRVCSPRPAMPNPAAYSCACRPISRRPTRRRAPRRNRV